MKDQKSIKIDLLAPNGLPIIGMLLIDGSTCDFNYSYDEINKISDFELLNKGNADLLKRDNDYVLVDLEGNEYLASDIEFGNMFNIK